MSHLLQSARQMQHRWHCATANCCCCCLLPPTSLLPGKLIPARRRMLLHIRHLLGAWVCASNHLSLADDAGGGTFSQSACACLSLELGDPTPAMSGMFSCGAKRFAVFFCVCVCASFRSCLRRAVAGRECRCVRRASGDRCVTFKVTGKVPTETLDSFPTFWVIRDNTLCAHCSYRWRRNKRGRANQ